jgi:hypothetical protein
MFKCQSAFLILCLLIFRGYSFDLFWDTTGYGITVSEQEINYLLAPQFPKSKDYSSILGVTVSNPNVHLHADNNKIFIDFNVKPYAVIEGMSISIGGLAHVSSIPYYNDTTHSLFVKNISIDSIEFPFFSLPNKSDFVEAITDVLNVFFNSNPIYRMDANDFSQYLFMSIVKSIEIREGKLFILMDLFK